MPARLLRVRLHAPRRDVRVGLHRCRDEVRAPGGVLLPPPRSLLQLTQQNRSRRQEHRVQAELGEQCGSNTFQEQRIMQYIMNSKPVCEKLCLPRLASDFREITGDDPACLPACLRQPVSPVFTSVPLHGLRGPAPVALGALARALGEALPSAPPGAPLRGTSPGGKQGAQRDERQPIGCPSNCRSVLNSAPISSSS